MVDPEHLVDEFLDLALVDTDGFRVLRDFHHEPATTAGGISDVRNRDSRLVTQRLGNQVPRVRNHVVQRIPDV